MKNLSNIPATQISSIPLSVLFKLSDSIPSLVPLIMDLQSADPTDAVAISLLEFKIACELIEEVQWYKYPVKLKKRELYGLMQCYMGRPYSTDDFDTVS